MSTIRPHMPHEVRSFLDREVPAERQRQAEKGYDQAHDDEHGPDGLNEWAERYLAQGRYVEALALVQAAADARYREGLAADIAKAGDS